MLSRQTLGLVCLFPSLCTGYRHHVIALPLVYSCSCYPGNCLVLIQINIVFWFYLRLFSVCLVLHRISMIYILPAMYLTLQTSCCIYSALFFRGLSFLPTAMPSPVPFKPVLRLHILYPLSTAPLHISKFFCLGHTQTSAGEGFPVL